MLNSVHYRRVKNPLCDNKVLNLTHSVDLSVNELMIL